MQPQIPFETQVRNFLNQNEEPVQEHVKDLVNRIIICNELHWSFSEVSKLKFEDLERILTVIKVARELQYESFGQNIYL